MDNIKDRQFYWEVKQFFNGKPENNVPAQPKPSLKDAVSGVLKENNPYKQTNFSNNQTSVNAAQNAMKNLGAVNAANKPSCVAYTKNAIKNPFNLNEGFWMDAPEFPEIEDRRRQARANSTQQNFGSPTAPKTAAQQQLERDTAAGKPGTQRQAYYSNAPLVQDSIDKYKEQNPSAPPAPNTDNRSFTQKAADVWNDPNASTINKLGAGVVYGLTTEFGMNTRAVEDYKTKPIQTSTPVQTQTPKPASASAPVQGQSQAPDAQTKAPVQGQIQSVPAKNQPTATNTTPYKRQYVSSEPEGQPKRGPGGGVIAPPVPMDDRKASDMPGAYQDKRMEVSMNLPPIKNDIRLPNMKGGPSLAQRTQPMVSAGQYRGSSNMGMATRPNRPEAMTLQSAMAQQNQQATRNTLGQMGAVQGTPGSSTGSSTGFQGSVLPPVGRLTSMGTQKENEFKYARGSRLA
jgi:hypothetical protein